MTTPNEPFPGTPAWRAMHGIKLKGDAGYSPPPYDSGTNSPASGKAPDLVDRLLDGGGSSAHTDDILAAMVKSVSERSPVTFAKCYLVYSDITGMGSNSLLIAAALVSSFSGDKDASQRILQYGTFAEQMRNVRGIMRGYGQTIKQGFNLMDRIHKAVDAGEKGTFDTLYEQEPALERLASLMTQAYQLSGQSEYFLRLNGWKLDRMVEDVRNGNFGAR